ncbi:MULTISPECIES: FMN-binding glutamate synthase family protein [Mycobacterium]|uniref:FMN-binding glutamate synthase family protein n=1 Tax=Mycobacterium TaxID=1763 RepID=UPI000358EF07|nr:MULTISPECIES: FMN-binding glutamate synthase family protein [Mycobacterium]EPQ49028.1 Ferredoxin-dependent glutamate synthase [Mycobacterium sp. 012931]BEH75574.1 FMN-binding glutamate synthase family protein [Mycobacterium pseudoshottsii]
MKPRSVAAVLGGGMAGVAGWDLWQRRHAILRNFPIIGHLRFLLEAFGPELRQYIVTDNNEERPFSRDQRRWVYTSSKLTNRYFGFGTDNDLARAHNYPIIKHAAFPVSAPDGEPAHPDPAVALPAAKVLGGARGRAKAFRPSSLVNISGMSYGALGGAAISALNQGAGIAGALHTTGEGAVSPYHLNGGDLVWQIGTGYFGCRNDDGTFSLSRLIDRVAATPSIRAIEIKLRQGAKPGLGGMLPGAKVTADIAAIRGIPVGVDCKSPAGHSAFADIDGMLELVETIADATGLPVGIKSAVGEGLFWPQLAARMARTGRGVDFVTVDGGEGGTGAAPLVFSDHVALPFKWAFPRVFRAFAEEDLHHDVVFIGSAKLGIPENALLALAMGADMINVGRTAMFAIGCIQAQRCHTGRCPSGVATQSAWLQHGLDPALKAVRCANYLATLRFELLSLARDCGYVHPALVPLQAIELLDVDLQTVQVDDLFGYQPGWGIPSPADVAAITALMTKASPPR